MAIETSLVMPDLLISRMETLCILASGLIVARLGAEIKLTLAIAQFDEKIKSVRVGDGESDGQRG
jgi:hypothetical protein